MKHLQINKAISGNYRISTTYVDLTNYVLNVDSFSIYINKANLNDVLNFVYNIKESKIYYNKRSYKSITGAKKMITKIINKF